MTPEGWIFIGAIVFFHGFLAVIITEVWDPFHVRRRVMDLEDAVKRVWQIRRYLDLYLDLDLDHPLDPLLSSQRCKGWLRRMRDLQDKADEIMAGHKGCGLNYFSKCYYGKKADKLLKKATGLIETGEALLTEAQTRHVLPLHPRNQLWGMDSDKQKALHFILDGSSRSGLLGIWGIPGVGKTSLLELVRDSFAEYALLFDHVLFIRAGRGATVGKTQEAISATLGLPFITDESSQEAIINSHLQDKSFLLLIDDLWGKHDLKLVGIPTPLGSVQCLPHGGGVVRKVVFTTSSYDVCREMGCANNTIRLECLSEDDAWNLFEDKLGKEIINDYDSIHYFARKLLDECGGLPLALCTIGQAMSTKKDPMEWRDAIFLMEILKLRHTIIMRDTELYRLDCHDITENDLKKLRKTTDFVDTSDELLKVALALVVMLTSVSKDRIVSYIRLKEIDLPSLHGMVSYEMKVLGFVEDETSSLLGIWGLRGVGKTTLLRFVHDYAHDFSSSRHVFFVGAGSGCTVRRLQHALCINIGLDPPPPPHIMSDVSQLAQLISNSLEGTPFLLLVDDVLERLDLAALGVPMPLRRNQKVIFTTRNKAICTEMGCTEDTSIIHMKCLGKEDAWNLFNDKVGDEIIDDHPQIRHLAEKMVAECRGLPSALCTLGRAMSTKRDVNEWRYAYDVLLKCKPPHHQVDEIIQEMDDQGYSHLHQFENKLRDSSFF